jgi:hypothetical protein
MVNFVVNLTGQIKAINKSSNFGIEVGSRILFNP